MMKKIFFAFLLLTCAANYLSAQILTSSGGGNNFSISPYPGNFTGYYDGFSLIFRSNQSITGPANMTVAGIGPAQPIVNTAGNALGSNDIIINQIVTLVYNSSLGSFQMVTTSGNIGGGGRWSLSGNGGTTSGTDFIGTTDAQNLDIRTASVIRARVTQKGQLEFLNTGQSVFLGEGAGANDDLSTNNNVFVGYNSGNSNSVGSINTGVGYRALMSNTNGGGNTALGTDALRLNANGLNNTAVGNGAMVGNGSGNYNVVSGSAAMQNNSSGSYNTSSGMYSLFSNVSGNNATAFGYNAMYYSNNTATAFTNYNVAVGYEALRGSAAAANNTGNSNTAVGYQSIWNNTGASNNVAVGTYSLKNNTYGGQNTALGEEALFTQSYSNGSIPWATDNVAVGYQALFTNNPINSVTGFQNTAIGSQALKSSTNGGQNTATGMQAMFSNTTGYYNTASGMQALYNNLGGPGNSAFGVAAMYLNISGNDNTAMGHFALYNSNGNYNTAVGESALQGNTNGNNNTGLGEHADVLSGSLTNATAIGYRAAVNVSDALVLGSISGVNGAASNTNVGIGTTTPGALLDLGTAGTSKGVFRMAGNTSGNVTVQPAPAAGTWTLTVPTNAGTNGQFLQTDGAGITSWQAAPLPAGSTNQTLRYNGATWVANSYLWNTGAAIGINTTNPMSALDVNGGVAIGTYAGTNAAPANGMIISGNVGIGLNGPNVAYGLDILNGVANGVGVHAKSSVVNGTGVYGEIINGGFAGVYGKGAPGGTGNSGYFTGGAGVFIQNALGIGTSTPNTSFQTTGGVSMPIITLNAAGGTTLDQTRYTVILRAGFGGVVLLPTAAATNLGWIYVLVNQTGAGVTINNGGAFGYLNFTNANITTIVANSAITIQSDGINWYQIK